MAKATQDGLCDCQPLCYTLYNQSPSLEQGVEPMVFFLVIKNGKGKGTLQM